MMTDTLHVVHARAAQVEARTFEALASGLDAMVAWLRECSVDAVVMEGSGVYWLAPFEALEADGIPATLANARQVKQLKGRKTDVADSVWLARVCQFGLATPSHVPPKAFRELRVLTRYRRTLVARRSRPVRGSSCGYGGIATRHISGGAGWWKSPCPDRVRASGE